MTTTEAQSPRPDKPYLRVISDFAGGFGAEAAVRPHTAVAGWHVVDINGAPCLVANSEGLKLLADVLRQT